MAAASSPTVEQMASAERLLAFVDAAPSPYHAVDAAKTRLLAAGYRHLDERAAWTLERGGRYFFTRNQSTLVAFEVGHRYSTGGGLLVVGAHTDSPCLTLKPKTRRRKEGYVQLAVQTYGGGLWHTWFDRDLGLAGRVLVRTEAADGSVVLRHRLVRVNRPVLRVPMLAIHLNRDIYSGGFKPNHETELAPILATEAAAQLGPPAAADGNDGAAKGSSAGFAWTTRPDQCPVLLELLADELGCAPEDVVDFDLRRDEGRAIDAAASSLGPVGPRPTPLTPLSPSLLHLSGLPTASRVPWAESGPSSSLHPASTTSPRAGRASKRCWRLGASRTRRLCGVWPSSTTRKLAACRPWVLAGQ